MARLPHVSEPSMALESLPDYCLFLIDSLDPWYWNILVYLQTQHFRPKLSKDDCRWLCDLAEHYLIIGDALYHRGVDTILHRCVTHGEVERIMNDCHSGACGGHLFGLATTQKILCVGFFWLSIFKDCINVVKKYHSCQIFSRKMHAHPAPLRLVVFVRPFTKWGIDFTMCNPPSTTSHHYIIVFIDYFTKWVEAMPTYSNDAKTTTLFLFNHIIASFGIPRSIVTDHGMHFWNAMMAELTTMLHLDHECSSPYYPQGNG